MKNCSGVLSKAILSLRINNWRLWLMILIAALAGTVIPRKIGITLTPSLDHRIFWMNRNPERVGRGDCVFFVDADLARKVGKPDVPNFFKIIRCDEGDNLYVDAGKSFYCNGEFLGSAKDYSRKGEKMQYFAFNGNIPKGFMFVMGEHRDSYDSRYFGFVEKSRVRARLYPIF
ncbi:MAG: S26 family signal peptidase [Geobacter sp.]|nr:S26 family signal peptidase [Geobacter sp.]